jgi:hypothetical protein
VHEEADWDIGGELVRCAEERGEKH